MSFDLGLIMQRKQERECARLDAFDFRRKARMLKLVAEQVRSRGAQPETIDPLHFAAEVASHPVETILAELRGLLTEPVDDAGWDAIVAAADRDARLSLVSELGEPTPCRLA